MYQNFSKLLSQAGVATGKVAKLGFVTGFAALSTIAPSALTAGTKAQENTKVAQAQDKRPNIIFLVADDMGYSDISPYGGEISTPNLEALSKKAVSFTNYRSSPVCSPSRSMLLTGVDNHIAGLGTMFEYITPNQKGKPGYEGVLSDRIVTLPQILKDAGYHTYMVGKWHLGEEPSQTPDKKGFTKTFSLLEGGGDHYSNRGFSPKIPINRYNSDGKDVTLPKDFYATKFYTDKMIEYIESNRKDGKPFFTYFAYTAPHSPYQAPKEYIDKYINTYTPGWDKVRAERFKRMQKMGLIPDYVEMSPRWEEVKAWDELTPEGRRTAAKTMAIYAAMVDYLDMSIGRFIDYLKQTGQYENTIFVFISDNGADGHNRDEDEDYAKWFQQIGVDNSYENMGLPNSFVTRGIGWAQVSVTPFYAEKATEAEGGIRDPLMIYYPGKIESGRRSDAVVSIKDIAPTVLDYAGVRHPGNTYQGRPIYPLTGPLAGRSLRPLLEGRADRIRQDNEAFGAEVFGTVNKALYWGDWKILKLDPPFGDRTWKLFNLRIDPGEQNDLSKMYPTQLQKMIAAYDQYEKEVGFVPTKPDQAKFLKVNPTPIGKMISLLQPYGKGNSLMSAKAAEQ